MCGVPMPGEEAVTIHNHKGSTPEPPSWLMENIAVASKNAAKIYTVYLGFIAYCALTIISTTDRQIILNEQAHLPIINLDVPLNGFFWLSPILLLLFFVYFQIYLHRLKSLITELKQNYPSVQRKRLYPWILNIAEEPEPGRIGRLQVFTVTFTLWLSLPILLTLNAFWYIRKHEPVLSYLVGILTLVGIIVVVCFWWSYDPSHRNKSRKWLIIGSVAVVLVLMTEGFVIHQFIQYAREGGRHPSLKPFVCVDLSYQKLINEPQKDMDYPTLYWGNLTNVHLEGANLENSVLSRCDMRGVQLQKASLPGAVLFKANLAGASLREANLMKAYFYGANLRQSDLCGANLAGALVAEANLERCDLRECNLTGATLEKANLNGVNLAGGNLSEANLQVAIFRGANLQKASLKGARGNVSEFQGADLRDVNLQESSLHGVNFQNANLTRANLKNADLYNGNLQKADLRGANLTAAKLQGADLTDANLQGAILEVKGQLSEVKTLYGAKLDSDVTNQLKKAYPQLLEKPKD